MRAQERCCCLQRIPFLRARRLQMSSLVDRLGGSRKRGAEEIEAEASTKDPWASTSFTVLMQGPVCPQGGGSGCSHACMQRRMERAC